MCADVRVCMCMCACVCSVRMWAGNISRTDLYTMGLELDANCGAAFPL